MFIFSLGRFLAAAFLLSIPFFSYGQHAPKYSDIFTAINNEVLEKSQGYNDLKDAIHKIGHRMSGTDNGRRAESYAHELFRKYGYKSTSYQPFAMNAWVRESILLEIVPLGSDNFVTFPAITLAHSPLSAEVSSEIVDLGDGLRSDFEKAKDRIANKIVLFNADPNLAGYHPSHLHRSEKAALAIQYGASGIIIINLVPGRIMLTGTASVTGELIPIPAVCISMESGKELRKWLREEKLLAQLSMTNKWQLTQARNVVANIKGAEKPNEKIIIGAHLDSWDLSPGAIDNGIGAFTVIEMARALKALGIKPKRTIEFVLFMGKEQGLIGSSDMVNYLKSHNNLKKVRYMINLDMTGNAIGLNVCGRAESIPFFSSLGKEIQGIDSTYLNKIENRPTLYSDHVPFLIEGIPVILPLSNMPPQVYNCFHSNCDNLRLVDKKYMDNSARFLAMLVYGLANADNLPARSLTPEQTKSFLSRYKLKERLIMGNDWKWDE